MLLKQNVLAGLLLGNTVVAASVNLSKRDEKLTISYCTECIPIGEGGVNCINNFYIHWGDDNLGGCNDSSFLYDDGSCSTSGATVPTPSGDGVFTATNCGAGTDEEFATITANGNTYTCYKANNQNFDLFCGASWACSVYASCYGP